MALKVVRLLEIAGLPSAATRQEVSAMALEILDLRTALARVTRQPEICPTCANPRAVHTYDSRGASVCP